MRSRTARFESYRVAVLAVSLAPAWIAGAAVLLAVQVTRSRIRERPAGFGQRPVRFRNRAWRLSSPLTVFADSAPQAFGGTLQAAKAGALQVRSPLPAPVCSRRFTPGASAMGGSTSTRWPN